VSSGCLHETISDGGFGWFGSIMYNSLQGRFTLLILGPGNMVTAKKVLWNKKSLEKVLEIKSLWNKVLEIKKSLE